MPERARRGPDVTVMVTTYDGAERIGICLDSLARQTLSPERFEILVVQNGPVCATPQVVADFAATHPHLQVRLLELSQPGLGHARNVGLGAARGIYVTYVDDDDWVTPRYLEVLLGYARQDVVPVALVSTMHGHPGDGGDSGDLDDELDFDNYASRNLLPHAGQTVPCDRLATALYYNAGKLLPTQLARQVRYDDSLRSGEDFVYWLEVLIRQPFQVHVVRPTEKAVYCRALREGSLGRQSADYDFLVTQRLDCLDALQEIGADHDKVASRVSERMREAQARWANRYLRKRPAEHGRVLADTEERGLTRVPWRAMNRGLGHELSLLFRSAPHLDSSLQVAAPGLVARGSVVDVVTDDPEIFRTVDADAPVVLAPYVDRWATLESPPETEDPWAAVRRLAAATAEQVTSWETDKGPYGGVRSRSSAPESHLVAALLKTARPSLRWTAELGEPAASRPDEPAVPDDEHSRRLRHALHEQGVELPRCGLSEFSRLVTYALADRLVVGDLGRLESLLASCPDPVLADRVRLLAEEEPAALPPAAPRPAAPGGTVRLACYGFLDGSATLAGIGAALGELDWRQRQLVHLDVCTGAPERVRTTIARAGLGDVVTVRPLRPLDDFLAGSEAYDVLVLGEPELGTVLPRRGSVPVWAVAESEPVEASYSSRPGDVRGAAAVLRALTVGYRQAVSERP